MTVETIPPNGTALAVPSVITSWAADAAAIVPIANNLANSALVPRAYQGKPADILAAMMTGQELGIPPMASLRSLDVIQGMPSLRAHAIRALVQSRGHSVQIVESDDTHCVMRGRRAGEAEWQTVTWDMDRARKLGLAGKDQWKNQPRTMLIARATGEICRLIASDVLFGVAVTEEAQDSITVEATVTKPTLATITGKANEANEAKVETVPANLTRRMWALVKDAGRLAGTETRTWMGEVIGREIESSKELTADEVRKVIAALEQEIAAGKPELSNGEIEQSTDHN